MTAFQWHEFLRDQPDFAAEVKACFETHPHHVLATLRADGAPRLSGINVFFSNQLRIGSMPTARKNNDLRRDPRCSLHSAPLDEHLRIWDAIIECVATELDPAATKDWLHSTGHPTGDGVAFDLHLIRVTITTVANEQLRIRSWAPNAGVSLQIR
jgi:hypothetical protein